MELSAKQMAIWILNCKPLAVGFLSDAAGLDRGNSHREIRKESPSIKQESIEKMVSYLKENGIIISLEQKKQESVPKIKPKPTQKRKEKAEKPKAKPKVEKKGGAKIALKRGERDSGAKSSKSNLVITTGNPLVDKITIEKRQPNRYDYSKMPKKLSMVQQLVWKEKARKEQDGL